MSHEINEALKEIRRQLASGGSLMETLVDLMIISELWEEDEVLHVIAWIPDLENGRPRYHRKHIVYDKSAKKIVRIKDLEQRAAIPA